MDLHRHTALIGPRENTVVIGTVHGVAGIGGVNFYAQKFFLFQGLFQEFQGRFDRVADIDIRETEEAVFRLQAHGEQVIMDGAGLKIHGEHVGIIERHDAGGFDMVLIHEPQVVIHAAVLNEAVAVSPVVFDHIGREQVDMGIYFGNGFPIDHGNAPCTCVNEEPNKPANNCLWATAA